jgi:hypothetical protein
MGGIKIEILVKSGTGWHLFRPYESCRRPIWNSYPGSYTSGSHIFFFPNCDLRRRRHGASHEDFHSKRKEALRASRRVAGRRRPDGRDARQARRGRPVPSSRVLVGGVHIFIKCTAGLPDLGAGFGHTPNALGWSWRPANAGDGGKYLQFAQAFTRLVSSSHRTRSIQKSYNVVGASLSNSYAKSDT